MTLNTALVLHEWTDPVELHTWFNREVLNVAHRSPIINQSETGIGNQLGQGFDAIFEVSWEKGHGDIVRFDFEKAKKLNLEMVPEVFDTEAEAIAEAEEERASYSGFPRGVIEICWDTAYGYEGDTGESCSMLHAKFITRLATEYLAPRGIGFSWQNEYTGDWHEGLDGLDAFIGQGENARAWYSKTVLPAITALLTTSENG